MAEKDTLVNPKAEEELLSAMFFDQEIVCWISEYVQWHDFADPTYRAIAKTMWQFATENRTITPATIEASLPVDGKWRYICQRLSDNGIPTLVEAARDNAVHIRLLSQVRTAITKATDYVDGIKKSPDDVKANSNLLIDDLSRLLLASSVDDSQNDIANVRRDEGIGVPCGLRWLDDPDMIGGIEPTGIWLIQGMQGGRKTSFTNNLVRSMTRPRKLNGEIYRHRLAVYLYDGTKALQKQYYIAQEATYILAKNGASMQELRIKGKNLHRMMRTPAQQEAIVEAERRLNSRTGFLRLYDGSDDIAELPKLIERMKRDVLVHGIDVFVIDYLQEIIVPGVTNIFETNRAVVRTLKQFGQRYGVRQLWLSQRSESGNQANGNTDGFFTKGGGDAPAAASTVLDISNPGKMSDEEKAANLSALKVRLLKSRHSGRQENVYAINPDSGLILNPSAVPEVVVEYESHETHSGGSNGFQSVEGY